ncbi:hypothetical protein PTSG_01113 [Salpingoeca rosetta]|uniref:Coiled-coil domain-containing protein 77 n=1 Tax=Salpingoeca rosetta (strain ATCC 50818 / BSB-021) TaxID=946362 RepID=F2U0U8_SALR5|nr:uncharacterized protein PTSG_01113 [Salpingoeca rosetta]EGD80522.1 hypothetical protein PTSG_01113 [Salpingoeca rosetta]|eukprot:XP_004997083.1 hypothetical protein PTSG_01113 [Salpingoeca rosetta]
MDGVDQDVVNLSPLPPITQRLKGLRPSKELLEFYRQKLAEFDAEHSSMLGKLDKYKQACSDKNKLQWEMAQREQEIVELQKALSDMQVYLFQEREHVLRLYAENDRLKLQEVEDRKKIKKLLAMSQPLEHETTYFQDPSRSRPVVARGKAAETAIVIWVAHRRVPANCYINQQAEDVDLGMEDKVQTLMLTIEALKAQLEDQARVSREETTALMEDRRVREEEMRIKAQRDASKIEELTHKVQDLQDLLYDSTRDYLELKYEHRNALRDSEEEKERLLKRIEELKDDIDMYQAEALQALQERLKAVPAKTCVCVCVKEYRDMGTNAYRPGGRPDLAHREGDAASSDAPSSHARLSRRVRAFAPSEPSTAGDATSVDTAVTRESEYTKQKEVMQETLADMYREQCIQLEDELCRLKEEREAAKKYENKKAKSQSKRADMWKARYHELERRRALEVEGYKTDIKMLRTKMKDLEKSMYKLVLHGSQNDDQHSHMMQDIRKATARTSKMVGSLQNLKGRIYQLEHDVHRA